MNEVKSHAKQLESISEKQLEAFAPDGRIDEAGSLSDEMNVSSNKLQINWLCSARNLAVFTRPNLKMG